MKQNEALTVAPHKMETSPQIQKAAKEMYLATAEILGEDYGAQESSLGAASLFGEFVRIANYGAEDGNVPASFRPTPEALTYLREMAVGIGMTVGEGLERPSYDEILLKIANNLHKPPLYSGDAYYQAWIKPEEMAAKFRESINKIANENGLSSWQRAHAFSSTVLFLANRASETVKPPEMIHLHCVEAMLHAAHRPFLPSQDKSIRPPVFQANETFSWEGECLYKVALNVACRSSGYNPEELSELPDGVADTALGILCGLAGEYAAEASLKNEPNVQGADLPQETEIFLREVYSFFVESAGHPMSRKEILAPYEEVVEDFLQKNLMEGNNDKTGPEEIGIVLIREHLEIHAAEKKWGAWAKASVCGCAAIILASAGGYLFGEEEQPHTPIKTVRTASGALLSSAYKNHPLFRGAAPVCKWVNHNNGGGQNALN